MPAANPSRNLTPETRNSPHDLSSFHTHLAHAQSTKLDDLLKATNLTKDQAEHLLASTRYKDYNNLKTSLLQQQLQIQAQDHVQFCLQRLAELSHCKNPITARLATQDLLHYTAIAPPEPASPAPPNADVPSASLPALNPTPDPNPSPLLPPRSWTCGYPSAAYRPIRSNHNSKIAAGLTG